MADCAQLEKEVLACKEYYEELLKSAERGKLLDTSTQVNASYVIRLLFWVKQGITFKFTTKYVFKYTFSNK